MGQSRIYTFMVGVEQSTQPDPGTPSASADVVPLSYLTTNYAPKRRVTNTYASAQQIVAGTAIAPAFAAGEEECLTFVEGDGGAVTVTANPRITAPGAAGKRLTLVGTDDTNTVTLANGNGLALNGPVTLGDKESITLISIDASTWQEESRS